MATKSGSAMQGLRMAFGILEWLAPGPGAMLAERLWFMLPSAPHAARRNTRVGLPPGADFGIPLWGRQLRGTAWGEGPVVYLVHGWSGWGLQLAAYVQPLVAAGYRVVAYDALSHGESDPGRNGSRASDPLEAAASLRAVVDRYGPPHAVIAHSMGAIIVMHAVRDGLPAPARLVFVAAANTFEPSLNLLSRLTGMGARVRRRLVRRVRGRLGLPYEYFDVCGIGADLLAERGELPPLLAIHDRDDPEMPFAGSVQITEGWPAARLRATDGLGHRKPLWHPELVTEVTAFIASNPVR